jgi:hypothetical protein
VGPGSGNWMEGMSAYTFTSSFVGLVCTGVLMAIGTVSWVLMTIGTVSGPIGAFATIVYGSYHFPHLSH